MSCTTYNQARRTTMSMQMQLDAANSTALSPGGAAPAPTPVPAPVPQPTVPEAVRNIMKLLLTLASTDADAADVNGSFLETLKTIRVPATTAEVQEALQQLQNVPPEHIAKVLQGLTPEGRQLIHQQALLLSMAVTDAMPDIGQAVTILRLLIYRLLPAMKGQTEDDFFGTSAELLRNYKLVDYVAQISRPDENNPRFQDLARKAGELNNSNKAMREQLISCSERMARLGFVLEDEAQDQAAIKSLQEGSTALRNVLIAIIVLLLVLVIAALVLYLVKRKRTTPVDTEMNKFGGRAAPVNPPAMFTAAGFLPPVTDYGQPFGFANMDGPGRKF